MTTASETLIHTPADGTASVSPLGAGVIEGFFGRAWSWSARTANVSFLRESGYQFYIYAPKSDPFLRRRWREPMPADTQQQLSELSEHCRRSGLAFGVGLTPFEFYLDYGAHARESLQSKVRQIDEIGVDILCILFDDMRGDVDGLAELQSRVVADICEISNAKRFVVCPTYYSDDPVLAKVFGPAPASYLQDLGRRLDERIDFFWTGEKVISDGYPADHLERVASEMGRKPCIWDNYIANDARLRTQHLYLDPAAGSWRLPLDCVRGLAINPMNQPSLSRIALAGYMALLTGSAPSFAHICMRLCGDELAERLTSDLDLLQGRGLQHMDDQTRLGLREWYETRQHNPYAAEIAEWLRGEYAFDPQCLTV